MARELNKNRNESSGTNDEPTGVTGEPRTKPIATLASELMTDAYSIVVALLILSLSYWILFRDLPVELFTLGLVAIGLITANVAVALRRWAA